MAKTAKAVIMTRKDDPPSNVGGEYLLNDRFTKELPECQLNLSPSGMTVPAEL